MKKTISFMVVCILFIVQIQAWAEMIWVDIGENLFTDFECEDNSIFESVGTVSIDTDVVKSGGSSIKVENAWNEENSKIFEARGFDTALRFDTDKTYHVSMYIKLHNNSSGELPEQLQIIFNTNYDFERRGKIIPYSDSVKKTVSLQDTEDWQYIEEYIIVSEPKTASAYTFKNYSIGLYSFEPCAGVIVNIDEISVYEAEMRTEKYTNLVANPSCDTVANYSTFWNCTMSSDSDNKTEGTGSIKIQGTKVADKDAATYPIYMSFTEYLPGDTQYHFRADVKGNVSGAVLRFCMAFYDTDGEVLKNQINLGASQPDFIVADDWQVYERNFTINGVWSGYSSYAADQIGKCEIYAFVIKQTDSLKDNVWWFDNISLREIPEEESTFETFIRGQEENNVSAMEPIIIKCSNDSEIRKEGVFTVNGKLLSADEYDVSCNKVGSKTEFQIMPKTAWLNDSTYNIVLKNMLFDAWGRNLAEEISITFKTRKKVTLKNGNVSYSGGKAIVSIEVTNNEKNNIQTIMLAAACDGDYVTEASWSESSIINSGSMKILTAEINETSLPIRLIVLDDFTTYRAYDDVIIIE